MVSPLPSCLIGMPSSWVISERPYGGYLELPWNFLLPFILKQMAKLRLSIVALGSCLGVSWERNKVLGIWFYLLLSLYITMLLIGPQVRVLLKLSLDTPLAPLLTSFPFHLTPMCHNLLPNLQSIFMTSIFMICMLRFNVKLPWVMIVINFSLTCVVELWILRWVILSWLVFDLNDSLKSFMLVPWDLTRSVDNWDLMRMYLISLTVWVIVIFSMRRISLFIKVLLSLLVFL